MIVNTKQKHTVIQEIVDAVDILDLFEIPNNSQDRANTIYNITTCLEELYILNNTFLKKTKSYDLVAPLSILIGAIIFDAYMLKLEKLKVDDSYLMNEAQMNLIHFEIYKTYKKRILGKYTENYSKNITDLQIENCFEHIKYFNKNYFILNIEDDRISEILGPIIHKLKLNLSIINKLLKNLIEKV